MRSLLVFIFAIFCFAAPAPGSLPPSRALAEQAAPTALPTSEQWRAVAESVMLQSEFMFLDISVELATPAETEGSVLAATQRQGRCVVLVAVDNNPSMQRLSRVMKTPADWELFMELAVVHEFAHCYAASLADERLVRATRTLVEPNELGLRRSVDSQGAPRFLKLEEAFADIAALAWIDLAQPQAYTHALELMLGLRADAGRQLDVHANSDVLARLPVLNIGEHGPTVFATAKDVLIPLVR